MNASTSSLDLTLLTKWEPEGDVWPAVNGNSLFVFEGEEDLSLPVSR